MAASDALHPKLFHGSAAWLKPGEIIKPGERDAFYGPDSRLSSDEPTSEHIGVGAYASTSEYEAAYFAEQAHKSAEEKNLKAQGVHQREMFAPIYEVEHISEHSDPAGVLARSAPDFRRDTKGFRIKGISQYVPMY